DGGCAGGARGSPVGAAGDSGRVPRAAPSARRRSTAARTASWSEARGRGGFPRWHEARGGDRVPRGAPALPRAAGGIAPGRCSGSRGARAASRPRGETPPGPAPARSPASPRASWHRRRSPRGDGSEGPPARVPASSFLLLARREAGPLLLLPTLLRNPVLLPQPLAEVDPPARSKEHTSALQSREKVV